MESDSLMVVAQQIADGICNAGVATTSFGCMDDFMKTCRSIGDVLSTQEVAIVPGSHRHVSSPESIPAHSDGPEADIVGWYCVRQDEDNGESILVDSISALRCLSPEARSLLASVEIPYFDQRSPGKPNGYFPVLQGDNENEWRINYAPWLLPEMTESQHGAILSFQRSLAQLSHTKILLQPKQSLFVDNWRILHARGPLKSDSQRHLTRVWLRTRRESRPESIILNTQSSYSS